MSTFFDLPYFIALSLISNIQSEVNDLITKHINFEEFGNEQDEDKFLQDRAIYEVKANQPALAWGLEVKRSFYE